MRRKSGLRVWGSTRSVWDAQGRARQHRLEAAPVGQRRHVAFRKPVLEIPRDGDALTIAAQQRSDRQLHADPASAIRVDDGIADS